jgi:hypothetical protein
VRIEFTGHAERKFELLRLHGFPLRREQVEQMVQKPDRVFAQPDGTWIAQRIIGERHVLRVVFRESPGARVVITFYPGRRSRYEVDV